MSTVRNAGYLKTPPSAGICMATLPDKSGPDKSGPDSSFTQAFAELHVISNYSFLRGASHPEEMVARAAELGYSAIAIT
ncbi:MAG: PHP domain-containing protein, partial [Pseudomonadales bacterium]|nr:PHP domain-containing protein [Pseudomonadales bacterium]